MRSLWKTAQSALTLLAADARRRFWRTTFLRGLTSVFDLLGLLGVGVIISSILLESDRLDGLVSATGMGATNSGTVILAIGIVLALFVFKALAGSWLLRRLTVFLAESEAQLANRAHSFFFTGSLARWSRDSHSSVQWFLSEGPQQASSLALFSVSVIVSEGFFLVAIFGLLFFVSPVASIFLAVVFGVGVAGFQKWIGLKVRANGRLYRDKKVGSGTQIFETIRLFPELAVAGIAGINHKEFSSQESQLSHLWGRQRFYLGLPRYVIETLVLVGVTVLVLFFLVQGTLQSSWVTIGMFLAGGFRMIGAVLPLQNALTELRLYAPSVEKMAELAHRIDHEESASDIEQPMVLPKMRPSSSNPLSFDFLNVRKELGEKGGVQVIVSDFSISAGEYLGISGPSGAGKTSLAHLMTGLLEPTTGSVFVDGVPAREFTRQNPFGMYFVPQNPVLLNRTIFENITLRPPSKTVDSGHLRALINELGLSPLVDSQPDGLFQSVGGLTEKLSGGQTQRIALGRALFQCPRALILDEVSSALDAESEALISDALYRRKGSMTIAVISHRAELLSRADRVIRVENGAIRQH